MGHDQSQAETKSSCHTETFRISRHSGKSCYGAGYKVRTRDPLITNQVLYQLS